MSLKILFGGIDSTGKALHKERLKWFFEKDLIHKSIKSEELGIIQREFVFPKYIIKRIEVDKAIWINYRNFSESYKRSRIAAIDSARKKPDEFAKRLNNFIDKYY